MNLKIIMLFKYYCPLLIGFSGNLPSPVKHAKVLLPSQEAIILCWESTSLSSLACPFVIQRIFNRLQANPPTLNAIPLELLLSQSMLNALQE